jgi:methylthioribose-1-phosphate isomerase
VYNPAFDVVPAGLIRALVTEQGLIHSPDRGKVKAFLAHGQKVRAT